MIKFKAKPGVYRVRERVFLWHSPGGYNQWEGHDDYMKLGHYADRGEILYILPIKPTSTEGMPNGYVWIMSIGGLGVAYIVESMDFFLEPVKTWQNFPE